MKTIFFTPTKRLTVTRLGPKSNCSPSLFLAVLVSTLLTACDSRTQQWDVYFWEGDFNVRIVGGEVHIVDYCWDATATDIKIPPFIKNWPVVEIGEFVFASRNLENVTIPDTIVRIKDSAFVGNNLAKVVLPNSVVDLKGLAFAYNELISVTLSGSMTSIGFAAFVNNYLTDVI
ncbi:MAG: leucine-rich repeat domain-containing protein, partial [Treponema sp.]|nr:leucine-rich repeat domain-containing protein [Treponema sp.]